MHGHGGYIGRVNAAKQRGFDMTTRIFVYGTLMRGFGNNRLLVGQTLVGADMTRDAGFVLYPLGGTVPGVSRVTDGGCHVAGEVYDVDDKALARVDALEGNGRFYTRELVDLDQHGQGWMYLLPYGRYNPIRDEVRAVDGVQSWRTHWGFGFNEGENYKRARTF